MKRTFIIFLFLITANIFVVAQTNVSVELDKNSTISIFGTTNLISFKLIQRGEKLTKKNFNITATLNKNKIYLSQNTYSILVTDFTSNNKMALRDFLKLVKSNTYPSFQVQLNYIDLILKTNKNDYLVGNVCVNITITGITKQYIIPISTVKNEDLYTLKGLKKVNIHDFGLTPPIEMMGLIRVNEWIEIDFNIICKITTNKST